MRIYKSYVFRRKDPAIDAFRTVAQERFGTRNLSREDYKSIEEEGGPAWSTVKAWLEGDTMRPQNASLEAAGRALGYERKWVKRNGSAE